MYWVALGMPVLNVVLEPPTEVVPKVEEPEGGGEAGGEEDEPELE